jgi:hypothetical protein
MLSLGEVNLGERALLAVDDEVSPMIWARDWMGPGEEEGTGDGCWIWLEGRWDPDLRTALSLTKLPKDFLLSLMTTSSSSLGVWGGDPMERGRAEEGREGEEAARTGEGGKTAGRGGG